MSHTRPETPERNAVSPSWWTPRRTKAASLCGLVGGLGGLGIVGLLIGPIGPLVDLGVGRLLYPVWHVLLAVALLAAIAQYRLGDGPGRTVAIVLALSLGGYAGCTVVLNAVGPATLGDLLLPIGALTGTLYMFIRVFGSIYGIYLWRANGRTSANRLTAGLFISLLPAIFILSMLSRFGLPGLLINAPLYLAFIVLSYDLWMVDTDTSIR